MIKLFREILKKWEIEFWRVNYRSINPSIFQYSYLHHIALLREIKRSIIYIRKKSPKRKLEIIDIGCGNKPYLSLFSPFAKRYVGVDVDATQADIKTPAEKLPFKKASFDLALCFQTLEHVDEPDIVISEIYRVLRRNGWVILSTHGAWMYHPSPHDYYRWTNEGLEKLFKKFSEVQVVPMLSWFASILQLTNVELYSLACRYFIWKMPLYLLITLINIIGKLFLNTGQRHFTINYVVSAKK